MSKGKSQKSTVVVAIVVGICIICAAAFLILRNSREAEERQQKLVGRWVRPDGGYIVHIIAVEDDGQLDAAYYNPRPIHVARAETTKGKEGLEVFIELRDTGYPGATYELHYDSDKDTLVGWY